MSIFVHFVVSVNGELLRDPYDITTSLMILYITSSTLMITVQHMLR